MQREHILLLQYFLYYTSGKDNVSHKIFWYWGFDVTLLSLDGRADKEPAHVLREDSGAPPAQMSIC